MTLEQNTVDLIMRTMECVVWRPAESTIITSGTMPPELLFHNDIEPLYVQICTVVTQTLVLYCSHSFQIHATTLSHLQ